VENTTLKKAVRISVSLHCSYTNCNYNKGKRRLPADGTLVKRTAVDGHTTSKRWDVVEKRQQRDVSSKCI